MGSVSPLRVAVVGLVLLIPSCSRSHKPVVSVHGRIQLQGQGVAGAIVQFHPIGAKPDDPHPSAQTDDQGYFHLTSYEKDDGAPVGEYAVTVTWFRALSLRNPSEGDGNARNLLPLRYADPAASGLRTTIQDGPNELPPFQLHPR